VAKPPKAFDVWFVVANTVYRQVPYQVVADWTQQGRLGAADMLRAAGGTDPWKKLAEWELFADYISQPPPTAVEGGPQAVPVELPEHEGAEFRTGRHEEDDDDVDMIPLIDISMVLLVFFIIISATGALSPVDVPDMRYAGELTNDPDAITMNVEKASADTVIYSVRVGKLAPKPEYSRLPNPEAAITALDALLVGLTRPPEIRIACAKDLPSERVMELERELKKRLDKKLINSVVATVNDAPKPKN
jgi:biopolymer transport protein ExbD